MKYRSEYDFVDALIDKEIEPQHYDREFDIASRKFGKDKIMNIIGSITGGIEITNANNYDRYYMSNTKSLRSDVRLKDYGSKGVHNESTRNLIESDKSADEVVSEVTHRKEVDEASRPDTFSDFADKVRAMAMEKPKRVSVSREPSGPTISPREYMSISTQLEQAEKDLVWMKNTYRDLVFEHEQKAEPEGGPEQARLSKELERVENDIRDQKKKIDDMYKKLKRTIKP